MSTSPHGYQEGKAKFYTEDAFYRPQSLVGRDLAVLAAAIYRQQRGELRVLDAMTGCGVRPLRYQLEAGADWVWANEGNPEHHRVLERNLSMGMRPRSYRITHQDANQVFFSCYQQRDYYDLVDVDNFGGPSPYTANAMWATKIGGLLYLTSTDGRATGGHDPDRSLQTYGAYARSHPAVHEQGLRLLLGHAVQQAAARGLRAEPIFALFNGQIYRAMVRLTMDGGWDSDLYGFLAYCHHCGHYQTVTWRQLGRVGCRCHTPASPTPSPPVLTGPMWLGPLHEMGMLRQMATLAHTWGWRKRAKLLTIMQLEAEMPPYYFLLGDIGRFGQMDIPPRNDLIRALYDRGFRASPTHLDWSAIKTTASFAECLAVAAELDEGGKG